MKIAIVGLGYVGLPLSIQFARSCVSVFWDSMLMLRTLSFWARDRLK
jgi:hypothetical protein